MNKDKDNQLIKAVLENIDTWFKNGGFAKRMENFYNYAKKRDISDMLIELKVRFKYNRKLMNANKYQREISTRNTMRQLKAERKEIKKALTLLNNKMYHFFDETTFSFGCTPVRKITKEQFRNPNYHLFLDAKEKGDFILKKSIEKIIKFFDDVKLPMEYIYDFRNDDSWKAISKNMTYFCRKYGLNVSAKAYGIYDVPAYTLENTIQCNSGGLSTALCEYIVSFMRAFLEAIEKEGE